MLSIQVSGPDLVDENGASVQLLGFNRMGTEYACIQGWGIYGQPASLADNVTTFAAMRSAWHGNAVRVPLNEDCWLDRDTAGLPPAKLGGNYQSAIIDVVNEITGLGPSMSPGMVAIVELHWSAPAGVQATDQAAMPDADNSVDFWTSVATTFKDNSLVIFDLFNEPFPDRDVPPPADAWDAWLNGGTVHLGNPPNPAAGTFAAVGMDTLVRTVRATGATNPIMLGGLDYADNLDGLLSHLPEDGQLIASWHVYPGNNHGLGKKGQWVKAVAPIMAVMPVVAGEFGRDDCTDTDLQEFMDWMDEQGGSYVAWVWSITDRKCPPDGPGRYDLIDDYATGNPTNPTGLTIQSHYLTR